VRSPTTTRFLQKHHDPQPTTARNSDIDTAPTEDALVQHRTRRVYGVMERREEGSVAKHFKVLSTNFPTGKGKPPELHVLSHILSKLRAMITLGEALPYGGARGRAPSYFMGGGGTGMGRVETSKLISMLRNDALKIENVEVFERPKGKKTVRSLPFFLGGCYAVTFSDSLAILSSDVKRRPEDGIARKTRNVGNQLKT
jgi:hypothetical protein